MILVYYIFHGICHQFPDRALAADGFTMPLCSRCAGMYIGFLLALPAFVLSRNERATRLAMPIAAASFAALVWAADGVANALFIWHTPVAGRFAIGMLLAFALSPFVARLFKAGLAGRIAAHRYGHAPFVAILVAAAVALANIRPTPALLAAESWAAAAGLILLLAAAHFSIIMLVWQRMAFWAASVVAAFTVSAQLALMSFARCLIGV